MAKTERRVITVGVTGASGAIYARSVLRLLDADKRVEHVFLVVTDAGARLLSSELDVVAADPKKLPATITGTAARKASVSVASQKGHAASLTRTWRAHEGQGKRCVGFILASPLRGCPRRRS